MKPTFRRLAALGALGLSLCATASALAQDRPGGPGGQRGAEHQKMFEDMKHRRELRLHDLLQIKTDQEGAFRAYVAGLEALRPQRGPRPDRAGGKSPGRMPLTTPERLDRQAQRLSERQQRQQKAATVVKTFYAALTSDQRKAFDSLPLAFGGARGGHWRHRGQDRGPGGAPPL